MIFSCILSIGKLNFLIYLMFSQLTLSYNKSYLFTAFNLFRYHWIKFANILFRMLHLCSYEILVCHFLFLMCSCYALVSTLCWPHKISYKTFPLSLFYERIVLVLFSPLRFGRIYQWHQQAWRFLYGNVLKPRYNFFKRHRTIHIFYILFCELIKSGFIRNLFISSTLLYFLLKR